LALGADVAGALIPFATGGGTAVQAGRAANQAIDAARAADRAADTVRGIDRAADASRGLDRAGDGARSSHLADNFAPQSPSHNPINPSPINNSSGVHGNSNQSTNPQHVYIIKNPQTGELIKPGISGRPLNRDGSSPRANQQVNAMNRANPGSAEAVIVERNAGSRQNAKDIEQLITDRHAVRNNGAMPSPYHRSPLPSVGTQQDFYNKYGFPHNQTPYNGRY
jgi:URI fold toxin 2